MAVLSAYCYCNRAEQFDMPYRASIISNAKACSEGEVVVVTDTRFEDGTYEALRDIEKEQPNVRIVPHEWDLSEPGADGIEKAFARSETRGDVLMPFDVDETVREKDGPKLRDIATDMVRRGMPVVSCGTFNWANGHHVKWAEPCQKPRLTLNKEDITHGIPKTCWLKYPNGKIYSTKDSDGAGLISVRTGMSIEVGLRFSSPGQVRAQKDDSPNERELLSLSRSIRDPNHIWIDHASWMDFPRKWGMNPIWHYLWMHLHGELKEGLNDYKVSRDDLPLEHEFWDCTWKLPTRAWSDYEGTAADEMAKGKVLRIEWYPYPEELREWIESPRRMLYGIMEAEVPKPPKFETQLAWFRRYILRKRTFDY